MNSQSAPLVTVVIPAYNESLYLAETLRQLQLALQSLSCSSEILVVDNNSSDDTAAIAEEMGVKVVFEPYNQIARARNTGARHARGQFLLFLDADTHVTPEHVQQAVAQLETGNYCGGGVTVAFDSEPPKYFTWVIHYWNWLSRKMKWAAGCFIFCRRDAFEDIGGFNEKVYASEEIWLSRQLRRWGKKRKMDFCILSTPPILSSGRKIQWYSHWQIIGVLFMMMFFPVFVRFRGLCQFWYRRPGDKG